VELLVGFHEMGRSSHAIRAPGCPKINEDDLAFEISQVVFFAEYASIL
jgi:hypothetical protein